MGRELAVRALSRASAGGCVARELKATAAQVAENVGYDGAVSGLTTRSSCGLLVGRRATPSSEDLGCSLGAATWR